MSGLSRSKGVLLMSAVLALGCGEDAIKPGPGVDAMPAPAVDAAAADQTMIAADTSPAPDVAGGSPDTGPVDVTATPDVVAADLPAVSPDTALPMPDAARDSAPDAPPAASCAPPANINQPIAKLSATGCVDPADPRKLAAVVIPYELNSPLWSDAAVKTRGMVVPAGKKIHVKDCAAEPTACAGPADTGKFVFPVGTVMVKNFLFDDKFVETRLFVRSDASTWVGYSYQWNQAQTEATIVPDERTDVVFDTGKRMVNWTYPSRQDCTRCHLASAGSTLGPETAQLNRTVGGTNQLDRWQAMNLFDAAIPKPYKKALVAPYASEAGAPPPTATIEERVRSYLHANCAFCHRPDSTFNHYDMRYDVSFKDMKMCDVPPMKGDVGVPNSVIFKPASAANSVLWLRMNALPMLGRMPPIASKVIDQDAVKLTADWIASVASCPP
jgi:uncharacterized repeat protein (TIGR03806 family)